MQTPLLSTAALLLISTLPQVPLSVHLPTSQAEPKLLKVVVFWQRGGISSKFCNLFGSWIICLLRFKAEVIDWNVNISKKKKEKTGFRIIWMPPSPKLLPHYCTIFLVNYHFKKSQYHLANQSLLTVNIFAQHCVRCQLACCAHVATQWGKWELQSLSFDGIQTYSIFGKTCNSFTKHICLGDGF